MTVDDSNANYSGVRVATSTRGQDISVHTYIGCTREQLEEAGDLAMNEYVRVFLGMKRRMSELSMTSLEETAARLKAS